MYNGLLHLHSLLRWVIFILLIIAIIKHYKGMTTKSGYSAGDRKVDLFLMISAHVTLLVGLYQWFAGPWGIKLIQDKGFSEVMKNSTERFFAVEHMVGMIVAIILITVGRSAGKPSNAGGSQHRKAFMMFLIALIILLVAVPWPLRENLGRGWFPGM